MQIIFLLFGQLLQPQHNFLIAQQKEFNSTISGIVTDADSKEPLEGVNVSIIDSYFGSTTDSKGNYQIKLPEGMYAIKYSMVGYSVVIEKVVLKRDENKIINVALKPQAYELDLVVVSPKPDKYDASGLTAKLDRNMIKRAPGSAQDIFWTLQTLPGVSSGSDDSKLYVRGGSASENLVLFDGATFSNPYHFEFMGGGLFSIFNSRLVENVKFYGGGFPARFGDRLSAVLVINNKIADKENYHGELNLSLTDFNGIFEFPLKPLNGSGFVSLRRSYFDIVYSLIPDLKQENEAVPYFIDGYGKLDFDISDNLKLTLTGLSSVENLIGDFKNDHFYGRMESNGANKLFGVKLNLIPTTNTLNELNVYYSLTDKKSSYPGNSFENYKLAEAAVKNDFSMIIGNHDLHIGGWFVYKKDDVAVDIPAEINFYTLEDYKVVSSYNYNLFSLYIEDKFILLPKLKMNTGIRFDYADKIQGGVLSPRFNLAYAWNEHMSLSFDYGWYYQSPYAYEAGTNSNLKFKKAESFGFGIKHQFTEDLIVNLEFYNKKFYNLTALDGVARTFTDSGYGYSRGLELYVQFNPLEDLSGWISYSYSVAKRKEGIVRTLQYFNFDRTQLISAVVNYKFADMWALGAKYRYGTGTPFTPVIGNSFNQAGSNFIPILGEQNSARYPNYSRLDLRLTRQISFLDQPFEVYVELLNVFNIKNIVHWLYNYDYTNRTSMTVFPVLPVVGINKRF
ncbi:MAG: TonB-dependent receptor [Bacteroidota bacterium]